MRIRMAPYKVQYTPDFKINWGIERKDFPFPHREEKQVATFDLKTYVSEAKRRQMMENAKNGEQVLNPFNPFGGMGMPSNPFMSGMGGFPGLDASEKSSPKSTSPNIASPLGIDAPNKPLSALTNDEIDKMIADIDKKLAELEEEEKKEKEASSMKKEEPKNIELPKLEEQTPITNKEEIKKEDIKEVNNDKPKINVDADSIVMNDNVITDDEFFDDFFGEE